MSLGPAKDARAEALAFAHLLGEHDDMVGGFPSVAFHDGYRNYDERALSWIATSPRLDGVRSEVNIARWLDDYAAGAFARHLEKVWKRGQR